MYQEFLLLTHNTMIQDGLDDVLVVFCIDGGWLQRNSLREEDGVTFMSAFKMTGVDFGVDLVLIWQFECVI